MGDTMAKARKKSEVSESPENVTPTEASSTPTTTEVETRKMKDAERKAAEQEVRMRHVEGLRQQMKKKGIDVDNMKDPGFARLNPEVFATPLAKAGGVKVGRRFTAPVSAMLGMTSPYMKTTVAGYKGKPSGFRRVVGKVLSAAKKIIGIGDDTMGRVTRFERKKKIKEPRASKISPDISGLAFLKKRQSPSARRRSY